MKKMKTLTLQGTTFEVVDEQARTDIETLSGAVSAIPEPVQPDLAQNDPTQPDYVKGKETMVSDWNASEGEAGHVKNRTHYEETTVVNEPLNITWDGNTEGLVSVGGMAYKVSDLVLTDEQIKSATETSANGETVILSEIWDSLVADGCVTDDIVASYSAIYVRRAGAECYGMTFPEVGIYFAHEGSGDHTSSLTSTESIEHTKTVVHKINKKFLPDGYPDAKEIILFDGSATDPGADGSALLSETAVEIVAGQEYTVVFDGTTYNLIAFEYDGYATIGAHAGDFSQYPFSIYSDLGLYAEFADTNEHTLQVIGEKIRKMDRKLLPGVVTTYAYAYGNGMLYKDSRRNTAYTRGDLLALGMNFCVYVSRDRRWLAPVMVMDFGNYAEVTVWANNGGAIKYHTVEYDSEGA